MNWKRGFFRLWVLGACCWGAFWLLTLQEDVSPYFESLLNPQKIIDPFKFPEYEQLTRAEILAREQRMAFRGLVFALLPPLFVLMLGFSVAWVAVGFKRKT